MRLGQDLFVLRFEPPAVLDGLLVDPRVPRRGAAVLLFADGADLGRLAAEPLEPQRALWTELALGYECEARAGPATAFHFPWLMLSQPLGDPGQAVADIEMTRFHPACPDYDGPQEGRRIAATARTFTGLPLADFSATLREPAPLPAGLLRWVNRVAYPDVNAPGRLLDRGVWLLEPRDLVAGPAWRGEGEATLHPALVGPAAAPAPGLTVRGEAWHVAATYSIDGAALLDEGSRRDGAPLA